MAANSRTKHITKPVDTQQPPIRDYSSLQKNALRRDWDRNIGYTNEVERLLGDGIPMMQHYFIQPAKYANNPLAAFVSTESRPIDPRIGGTLGMTGGTNPYKEWGLAVGDHPIARVHADIPEIVAHTYNLFCVRNTYTIRRRQKLWEMPADEVEKFYQRQLAAFSNSSENGIKFVGYMIFADLSEEKKTQKHEEGYPGKVAECLQDPHFEEFKKTMFCPKGPGPSQKVEVPFCGLNLALEHTPAVSPDEIVTENDHLECFDYIRKRLRERSIEWERKKLLFDHDLGETGESLKAFQEALREVIDDMIGGSVKYRIALPNIKKEGFTITVSPSDIYVIMSHKDAMMLDSVVPSIVKPSEGWGFNADSLGCGQVIKCRGFKPGEALIIHKDALKFIIVQNETGQVASYPEPGFANTGHSMGYYLDLFEQFPRVYIKPKSGNEITYPCYICTTPASDAS